MGEPARKLDSVSAAQVSSTSSSVHLRAVEEAAKPMLPVMSPAAEQYVNTAPEEYLLCRQNQHYFPKRNPAEMRFKSVAGKEWTDIIIDLCPKCQEVVREERWVIIEDSEGYVLDMHRHSKTIRYLTPEDGKKPKYTMPPGSGRCASPTQIRQAHTASHWVGRRVRRLGRRSQGGTG